MIHTTLHSSSINRVLVIVQEEEGKEGVSVRNRDERDKERDTERGTGKGGV